MCRYFPQLIHELNLWYITFYFFLMEPFILIIALNTQMQGVNVLFCVFIVECHAFVVDVFDGVMYCFVLTAIFTCRMLVFIFDKRTFSHYLRSILVDATIFIHFIGIETFNCFSKCIYISTFCRFMH